MKNPIQKYRELRSAKMNRVQEETNFYKQRTASLKELNKTKDQVLTAIMKATEPKMSLNSELYGTTSKSIYSTEYATIRRLSRIAHYDSPAAQSLIGRFVDLTIGSRLSLQASPVWDLIPGAPPKKKKEENGNGEEKDLRQDLIKDIEARWKLWSKRKSVSYDNRFNFHKLSRNNFERLLLDGEYFLLIRQSSTRKKNGMTIQSILPENVQRVDSIVAAGNTEAAGIEYNSKGQEVAYHFLNGSKSTRVPAMGTKSGRVFVIHNQLGDAARGVGILAGIITELTKLADFQALEIQAAVINAMLAVVIETEVGGENKKIFPKEGISSVNDCDTDSDYYMTDADYEAKLNKTQFTKGGIIVQGAGEGQTVKSFDTKRPTANFEQFFKAVKRNLYSAKGMSIAAADYNFDASYSAARGELLVFWQRVMMLRSDHAIEREDVLYKMWLWSEIDAGNLILPGYKDNETVRDAWSNAKWIGPQRPDIDPKKSVDANKVEVEEGFKTRQIVTAERAGGDHDENVERLKSENKELAEANKPIIELAQTTFSNSNNISASTTTTEEGV